MFGLLPISILEDNKYALMLDDKVGIDDAEDHGYCIGEAFSALGVSSIESVGVCGARVVDVFSGGKKQILVMRGRSGVRYLP